MSYQILWKQLEKWMCQEIGAAYQPCKLHHQSKQTNCVFPPSNVQDNCHKSYVSFLNYFEKGTDDKGWNTRKKWAAIKTKRGGKCCAGVILQGIWGCIPCSLIKNQGTFPELTNISYLGVELLKPKAAFRPYFIILSLQKLIIYSWVCFPMSPIQEFISECRFLTEKCHSRGSNTATKYNFYNTKALNIHSIILKCYAALGSNQKKGEARWFIIQEEGKQGKFQLKYV